VTFTATVTSPAGTPTGTVDLMNGSKTIGMGTLGGKGQAIITASLSQGSYSITAVYAGNSSFQGSGSKANEFTLNTPTSTSTPSPTPTLPQVLGIAGVSSKKGLTSVTVSYNEPLSPSLASSSGLYQVLAAVTKNVKKHKVTLFTKALAIRSVSPNSTGSAVTIKLARPFKGRVQVMVQGNIAAGNGASNSVRFTQDL
jgi:hypothetical protein